MNKKEERKEKILKLYNEGIKIVEIAESLGISTTTVSKCIKELKEEGKTEGRKSKLKKQKNKEKTIELYDDGIKIAEIAEILDASVSTVSKYVKELKEEGKIKKGKQRKEKILKLCNEGIKIVEIAESLGMSTTTVSNYIKELKEEGRIQKRKNTNRKNPKKEENKKKVLKLYDLEMQGKEIAESLGISTATVSKYIKELKEEERIQKRKNPKKEEKKEKILELYNEGIKIVKIAESLGISTATVNKYIKELKEEERIQKRKNPKKEGKKEKTLELYNEGIKIVEIAESLGVSTTTVSNYIKELKEEGRKDISISAQKILNNEKLTKSDYKKVSEYFLNCQERLSTGKLKKEDLITIKKVAYMTYKYDYIAFYIKACIHLGQITEAKKVVNSLKFSKDFSAEQKEKLNELSKKIVEISKKRTVVIMLKEGKSIKEIAEYSGMRETEVAQLKRKLLAKNREVQPRDAIGDER